MADNAVSVRPLARPDLGRGFLESLGALRDTGGMDPARAGRILDSIESNSGHRIFVAERAGRIVGAATLLLERKFIHDGGLVGHIEDVAVMASEQRTGVGRALVGALEAEARRLGCYKAVLECADDLVPYYEGLGFRHHSASMRKDLG